MHKLTCVNACMHAHMSARMYPTHTHIHSSTRTHIATSATLPYPSLENTSLPFFRRSSRYAVLLRNRSVTSKSLTRPCDSAWY